MESNPSTMEDQPRKKRVNRAKLIVAVAIAIPFVLILLHYVTTWIAYQQLEQSHEKLRAAGIPVYSTELTQPDIPDKENAAVYLMEILPEIQSANEEFMSPWIEDKDNRDHIGNPLTQEDLDHYFQMALKHQAVFEKVQHLVTLTDWNAKHDYSMGMELEFEAITQLTKAAILLGFFARVSEAINQPDQVVQYAIDQFKLAELSTNEPGTIPLLVHLGCQSHAVVNASRSLRLGKVSEELHCKLEQLLDECEKSSNEAFWINTDAALLRQTYRNMRENNPDSEVYLKTYPEQCFRTHRYLCNDEIYFNDFVERIMLACRTKDRDRLDSLNVLNEEYLEKHRKHIFSRPIGLMFIPVFRTILGVTSLNHVVHLRCLRILNAIKRFGTEKLDELQLSEEALMDPYTGKRLQVKRTELGLFVYSLGPNEIDDGGQIDDGNRFSLDIGLTPSDYVYEENEMEE